MTQTRSMIAASLKKTQLEQPLLLEEGTGDLQSRGGADGSPGVSPDPKKSGPPTEAPLPLITEDTASMTESLGSAQNADSGDDSMSGVFLTPTRKLVSPLSATHFDEQKVPLLAEVSNDGVRPDKPNVTDDVTGVQTPLHASAGQFKILPADILH